MQFEENEMIKLRNSIGKVWQRLHAIDISANPVNKKDFEPGTEKIVHYGSDEAWSSYSFLIRKTLCRMQGVTEGLIDILDNIKKHSLSSGVYCIPFDQSKEHIFYDFDRIYLFDNRPLLVVSFFYQLLF